jgi:acyl-CoA thioesterase YciA
MEKSIYPLGFSCISSRIIMPGHMNAGGSLFGGLLIQWVDEYASIFVMETLQAKRVVTKKISEVIYNEPTHLGDVLKFFFKVKSVGNSSITIECVVFAAIIDSEDRLRRILNCDLVFVKLDENGRPIPHAYVISEAKGAL